MSPKEAKRKINIQQWTGIIQARIKSGLNVKEYCKQNNLSKDAYFYWQHVIRQEALTQSMSNSSNIVEINLPAEAHPTADRYDAVSCQQSSWLDLSVSGMTLHITEETSSDLLARTLGVIRHVE